MSEHLQENPFEHCNSVESVNTAMGEFSNSLALPYFSYLQLRGGDLGQNVFLSSYDPAWNQRYIDKQYRLTDPAAIVSRRSRLPFLWDHGSFLRPFRKVQRRVFHEAIEFRIGAGYSVPVAGPKGDLAVFSVAASRSIDLIEAIRSSGPKLQVTALQAHDRIMSFESNAATTDADATDDDVPVLSARELECLKWTAEGYTSDKIADTVCISTATVNYHLNKVIKKLGAMNRHHAAILAIKLRLI